MMVSASKAGRLRSAVFDVICHRLCNRAHDLARIVATQYSFEEWLNWEAFLACSAVEGWVVRPKPCYSSLGVSGCRDAGDLLIEEGGQRLLAEVGLVHDDTRDIWRDKLDRDMQKLARSINAASLQVIVVVSAGQIDSMDVWKRWLSRVKCWQRPTEFECSQRLPNDGQMIVRAW